MKKLIAGTMIAAGTMFVGAQFASAQDGYGADPVEVELLPGTTGLAAGAPSTAAPLPATGSEASMLVQIGLVSFIAGGVLVGASAVHRRRLDA